MQATDVEPTRMEAAKQAAAAFIENLPDTFNVGLVTFSGSTVGRRDAVHRPRGGRGRSWTGRPLANSTAIGEAVFTSLDQVASMAEGDERPRRAGPDRPAVRRHEHHRPQPRRGRGRRREAAVPVSTIAYGTQEGTVEIEGRQCPGPAWTSRPSPRSRTAPAAAAYTAESGDELAEVYEDIGSSIGWRTEPREITPYLAAAGFLLALGGGAMSLRWFSRLP